MITEQSPQTQVQTKSKVRSVAFAAFENKQYRWLFLGNTAIFMVISSKILVGPLLAMKITQSNISLANINIALGIPMFIGALLSGALVDRVERRTLMVCGMFAMLVSEAFVCSQLVFHRLEFWQLMLGTFVAGSAFPFIMPASTSMMYQNLGHHHISSGMSLISGMMGLSRVIAPWLMSVIVSVGDFQGAYAATSFAYVCGIICILQLPKSHPSNENRKPFFADIWVGVKYVLEHRQVAACLFFGMLPILLAMPLQYFLVVFVNDVWPMGAQGLGMMLAAMGVGGFIGSMVVARIQDGTKRLKLMLISSCGCAVCFAMFSEAPSLYIALIPLAFANGFAIANQTVNNVAVQLLVDDKVRGRVTSFTMLSFGVAPMVALFFAKGIDSYGAADTVFGASVMLLVMVVGFYLFSSSLRRVDDCIAESFKTKVDLQKTSP